MKDDTGYEKVALSRVMRLLPISLQERWTAVMIMMIRYHGGSTLDLCVQNAKDKVW